MIIEIQWKLHVLDTLPTSFSSNIHTHTHTRITKRNIYIRHYWIKHIYTVLTKDYTTGNATFKQGSRGTVIEATSRKDGKLKVKLDNDNTKTFRLIKQCDLQLYEGVALSSNSESQTEEQSFEY